MPAQTKASWILTLGPMFTEFFLLLMEWGMYTAKGMCLSGEDCLDHIPYIPMTPEFLAQMALSLHEG